MLDPNDPETVYVSGGGVSKSTDGGRTWQPAGLQGTGVYELAVDPEHAGILYAGTAEAHAATSSAALTAS